MAACPKCSGFGSKIGMINTERGFQQASHMWHRSHRGSPQMALLGFAASLGVAGVKAVFSQAYECKTCHHQWRKWG